MRVRFANLVGSTACKNQTGYESHTQERARTLSTMHKCILDDLFLKKIIITYSEFWFVYEFIIIISHNYPKILKSDNSFIRTEYIYNLYIY